MAAATAAPKKTTKKRATNKRATGKSKKKPKWKIITIKQMETRRAELGYSILKMATMLGVTNSTYHNWKKGRTVPHEAQQEKILKAMHSGATMVAATPPAGKSSTTRSTTGRNGTSRNGKSPTARVPNASSGSGQSQTRVIDTNLSPLLVATRISAIASIVHDYVGAQKSKASPASILKLVEGLNRVLP